MEKFLIASVVAVLLVFGVGIAILWIVGLASAAVVVGA